jgi:hypothetical protein
MKKATTKKSDTGWKHPENTKIVEDTMKKVLKELKEQNAPTKK